MTDEALIEPAPAGKSRTTVTSMPQAAVPAMGQVRLDEIGRALGLARRRLEPEIALPHPDRVTAPFTCPKCGHEGWTASKCAVCALFGADR